jgi:hypothetical protein
VRRGKQEWSRKGREKERSHVKRKKKHKPTRERKWELKNKERRERKAGRKCEARLVLCNSTL